MRQRVGQRHVAATAWDVDAQVLPEVDQLQRRAHGVAAAQERGVVEAMKVQQQAADRVGRAAAVVQQGGAVRVTGMAGVLLEGVQQRGEQGHGQAVARDHRGERIEHAAPAAGAGAAGGGVQQVGAVVRQQRLALGGRRVALVGDVVGRAGEPVDGAHGRAQLGRTQPRGDGEVFVVFDAHRRRIVPVRRVIPPGFAMAVLPLSAPMVD